MHCSQLGITTESRRYALFFILPAIVLLLVGGALYYVLCADDSTDERIARAAGRCASGARGLRAAWGNLRTVTGKPLFVLREWAAVLGSLALLTPMLLGAPLYAEHKIDEILEKIRSGEIDIATAVQSGETSGPLLDALPGAAEMVTRAFENYIEFLALYFEMFPSAAPDYVDGETQAPDAASLREEVTDDAARNVRELQQKQLTTVLESVRAAVMKPIRYTCNFSLVFCYLSLIPAIIAKRKERGTPYKWWSFAILIFPVAFIAALCLKPKATFAAMPEANERTDGQARPPFRSHI